MKSVAENRTDITVLYIWIKKPEVNTLLIFASSGPGSSKSHFWSSRFIPISALKGTSVLQVGLCLLTPSKKDSKGDSYKKDWGQAEG